MIVPWLSLMLACNFPAGKHYPLTGTVLEVHEDTLVVDHDDIDGFMKGMAMSFGAEPSLTRKVVPGDVVRAQLLVNKGTYLLTGLEVTGHEDLDTRTDTPPPGRSRWGRPCLRSRSRALRARSRSAPVRACPPS